MIIEMRVDRQLTVLGRATFGAWFTGPGLDTQYCYTLEDKIREVPGMPVASWKKHGITAIPSGRYKLELVDSPKFGKDTISLIEVEGFDYVRVHSVGSPEDTDGCIGVGDQPNREKGTMAGGISHQVLAGLKKIVKTMIDQGDEVWLTVNNPVGI